MWRLELRGGKLERVTEPALRLSPRQIAVKVRAFLVDDFSQWSVSRGGVSLSRWAFGVVVTGGEVGRYVVAHAENAAAEYVASDRYVYVDVSDSSALEVVHVAYVLEALDRLPRFRPVEVLGDDPRRIVVGELAEVGVSKWKIALRGAVVKSGRAVAVSRLVEAAGSCVVRFVDLPSVWALRRGLRLGVRLGLPKVGFGEMSLDKWAVVEV